LRAVHLARGGRPSQALGAVATAKAYRPDWPEAQEAERQIEKALHSQKAQVTEALGGVGSLSRALSFRSTLPPALRDLLRDTEEGTGPRDAFRRSAEADRIRRELRRAKARNFWLRAGLAIPQADWDEKAVALDEVTDALLARKPSTGAEWLQYWKEALRKRRNDCLADVDPLQVLSFFLTKDEAADAAEDEYPADDPEPEEAAGDEPDAPPDAPPPAVPVLAVPAPTTGRVLPAVPFEFWFWSRRDAMTKAAAVAAVLLLTLAGALAWRDGRARAERDAAFASLRDAAARLDVEAGRAAVARYRAAKPRAWTDTRDAVVVRIEREFAEWPPLSARNAAYARLTAAAATRDAGAASRAAEEFLAAPAGRKPDPRAAAVRCSLDEAKEWPNRQARDAAFAALTAAAAGADREAALAASERFRGSPPTAGADPRLRTVEALEDAARRHPDRKARDAAYTRLAALMAADPLDDAAAAAAAKEFLSRDPSDPQETRAPQVKEWQDAAEREPRRRERDAAYGALVAATEKDDDKAALAAADHFIRAYAADDRDSERYEQVKSLRPHAAEAPRTRARHDAYKRLVAALRAKPLAHEEAVRQADRFFANLPQAPEIQEGRTSEVRSWRVYALGTPRRERRDAAYKLLSAAAERRDEVAVRKAAEDFLANLPSREEEEEPATESVRELLSASAEWPNLRKRDDAHRRLEAAREAGEEEKALAACEDFLEAPPLAGSDPRTPAVLDAYGATLTAWLLGLPSNPDRETRSRAEQHKAKYRKLVPAPGR
jgi:hypothetical protein